MARQKKIDGKRTSINLPNDTFIKLKDMAHHEGTSNSQIITRLIDDFNFISFDVAEEQARIETEKREYERRLKELADREEELSKMGKHKRVLDKVMRDQKEEVIQDLVDAFQRKSPWEGINNISKMGHRKTGIKPEELISEAIERLKK
jgi:hypothetical protein